MIQELFNLISAFLAGDTVMSLYWGLAVGGSLFFILNLIFSSLGGVDNPSEVAADGTFDSVDHLDTGYADFHFLSLRAILAFVSVFGWCGVLWGHHGFWGFLGAFIFGLIAMSLTALSIWGMMRLQHSGNVKSSDFIGKTGTVYMTIPGGAEHGKVTVAIGGATCEIAAIAAEPLKTGTPVKVVELVDSSIYRVEKI